MARQVLENGVILPAEYSDDWYDDMTSNLTKLDDVIGSDSEKLSSADVGAAALSNNYNDLDNLPTIPTKTSDLTNDSNFVDTSNSAVASGITSAKVTSYDSHLEDTDIHVTTADKNKWNNGVSQAYVFRYSSTALVALSTNSNTLLDNTDNLKVGDKVIDSDGVLFSITAIDTANSTFSIGTALIDLALDANVVHTSGDETVGGTKTFSSDIILQGTTTPVIKTISNIVQDSTGNNDYISWVIRDKTDSNTVFSQTFSKFSGRNVDWRLEATSIFNGTSTTKGINLVVDAVNGAYRFTSRGNNTLDLGSNTNRWKSVYAMNYYYGSNNVEFSTKFVTTDTAQTISGNKTFSSINGVEPSSLSLPSDRSARIDISSYFTNTGTGDTNTYTVPANGYINLQLTDAVTVHCFSSTSNNLTNFCQTFSRASDGMVYVLFPVRKNDVFKTTWYTSTTVNVGGAYFVPCQGNV